MPSFTLDRKFASNIDSVPNVSQDKKTFSRFLMDDIQVNLKHCYKLQPLIPFGTPHLIYLIPQEYLPTSVFAM